MVVTEKKAGEGTSSVRPQFMKTSRRQSKKSEEIITKPVKRSRSGRQQHGPHVLFLSEKPTTHIFLIKEFKLHDKG